MALGGFDCADVFCCPLLLDFSPNEQVAFREVPLWISPVAQLEYQNEDTNHMGVYDTLWILP